MPRVHFQAGVWLRSLPGPDEGSVSAGYSLCGVAMQALLQGAAKPPPDLRTLQEIHGKTQSAQLAGAQDKPSTHRNAVTNEASI